VEAFYDNGRPLHITEPAQSVIKSFTYATWNGLTPFQKQQELMNKNVIVTGWPLKDEISFSESGLRKIAGTQSRQISINGRLLVYAVFISSIHLICIFQTTPSSLPMRIAIQQL
jgi:hypothetical protein